MKTLPHTAFELVRELDTDYPERSPDPKDTERELWMKAGERRLVRSLLARVEYTEDLSRET